MANGRTAAGQLPHVLKSRSNKRYNLSRSIPTIKRYNHPLGYFCWILLFLSSCTFLAETKPSTNDSLESETFVVTPAESSSATPQIAEVTRIVGEEARPTATLPPFPLMEVAPVQPRPDFVQLVGPLEYSIVDSDFYHLTPEGVGGIRITGTMRNGFQSAICVRPIIRELVQQGDNFSELPTLWDRMTLLVDGEQKESYGISGLGLPVWLSEEDQETQWIEGEDYCWFAPLLSCIHEVAFQFRQTSGDIQEYKWLFEIGD